MVSIGCVLAKENASIVNKDETTENAKKGTYIIGLNTFIFSDNGTGGGELYIEGKKSRYSAILSVGRYNRKNDPDNSVGYVPIGGIKYYVMDNDRMKISIGLFGGDICYVGDRVGSFMGSEVSTTIFSRKRISIKINYKYIKDYKYFNSDNINYSGDWSLVDSGISYNF